MGYSILIGERVEVNEYGEKGTTVLRMELPEAPKFDGDEVTGQSNQRLPSYSGWHDFVVEAGLNILFHCPASGLMRKHPGYAQITKKALAGIRAAINHHDKAIPPGFAVGQDPILARLLWLEWWMDWSLKNCQRPIIANS